MGKNKQLKKDVSSMSESELEYYNDFNNRLPNEEALDRYFNTEYPKVVAMLAKEKSGIALDDSEILLKKMVGSYFTDVLKPLMINVKDIMDEFIALKRNPKLYADCYEELILIAGRVNLVVKFPPLVLWETLYTIIQSYDKLAAIAIIEKLESKILNEAETNLNSAILKINQLHYETGSFIQNGLYNSGESDNNYWLYLVNSFAARTLEYLKNKHQYRTKSDLPTGKGRSKTHRSFEDLFSQNYQEHAYLFIDALKTLNPAQISNKNEWIGLKVDTRLFFDMLKKHGVITKDASPGAAVIAFDKKFPGIKASFVKPGKQDPVKAEKFSEAILGVIADLKIL